jgi:hypothetical protein
VNSARTPSSSIRKRLGSSSRDGQPGHVKIVYAGGVAAAILACSSSGTPAGISARIFRALVLPPPLAKGCCKRSLVHQLPNDSIFFEGLVPVRA